MKHCMTHDNLQIPLGKADFSWVTYGSYLKNENGNYCTSYAIVTPSQVVEATPLSLATSAQQAALYTLTQAYILA